MSTPAEPPVSPGRAQKLERMKRKRSAIEAATDALLTSRPDIAAVWTKELRSESTVKALLHGGRALLSRMLDVDFDGHELEVQELRDIDDLPDELPDSESDSSDTEESEEPNP